MVEDTAVETDLEEELDDEFDEVFGLDDDKKKARERIKKLVEEEKEKLNKKGEEPEEKKVEGQQKTAESKPEKEKPVEKEEKEPETGEAIEDVEEAEPEKEEKKTADEKKSLKSGKSEPVEEKKEPKAKKTRGPKIEVVEPTPQQVLPELSFLEAGEGAVLIGRKKSVFSKYGVEAALHIGRVAEKGFPEKDVFLDSLNPHVVFVCGARGSGKSYALGIMAEELALKNKNVGVIVIDPVGVFWSMKFPNREEKELEALGKWGLSPKGLDNIMVFIPKGKEKETPKGTYDATFSIRPSLLTSNDWCLTFGIDRFSPTGLLLEQAIEKIEKGFFTVEKERIRGKGKDYSIDDIVFCLENDSELNSRERGYKSDSIRALVSRFEAAKSWGIFDSTGTPLTELSRENQLTIIDTSFLDDNVTALIIGILARRVLAARKISTRKEAAKRFEIDGEDALLEFEIPPTWLFIDEAHTLIPSGNVKTPATEGLTEYVKQGRRPGCSLVFATQQPSAIDSKVLSQLDIIMAHKLVFNDDVKAVYKRTPAIIPHKYKAGAFIKTLPVGTALVGDRREETSRAFVLKFRPRMSQHEGREAETIEITKKLDDSAVQRLLFGMYWNRLRRDSSFQLKELQRTLDSMNRKYSASVPIEAIVSELKDKGALFDENAGVIMLKPAEEEKEAVEEEPVKEGVAEKTAMPEEAAPETGEQVSLLAFPVRINEAKAKSVIKRKKLGKLFGLLKRGQRLSETRLKHIPVFKVQFNYFNEKNAFREGILFINSLSGEFLHYKNGKFVESKGLKELYDLNEDEIMVLNMLSSPKALKAISKRIYFDESKILRILKKLEERGLVKKVKKKNAVLFKLKKEFELPPTPLHPLHKSIQKLPLVESEVLLKESERYSKKDVSQLLRRIWKKLVVKSIEEIYWPVFEGIIEDNKGDKSRVLVDAVTGKAVVH